ncbi:LysR family transcriptional regulator [Mesobaculum littorinae]|uniref:LysR family transcriptional regulator n=1 Tax=Mesobaculum littorinae TaxID=2486419 RepID=A0A438AFW2_9RHOB|nr:LysR substrate-binding domain-containing protein [Mesobaculum littorinae]RVV97596.1 LysR family transcriptional regulator [Mesobaculum littorinae]
MQHRQLEAFHAVMISGSTVRAAELMNVTQPAVSRLIAELEKEVRFALFDRVRGRLVPTQEGQLFFREVAQSFKGLDRLRAAAANIRDFGTGTLRIASLAAAGAALVPAAVRGFRAAHPDVRITLHITWSTAIRNGVADGQYDIGIAADEIDRVGVDSQLFCNYPGLIAMPPDHPLVRHDTITPKLLEGCPLIGLAPEDRARQRFDAALSEAGVTPHYVVDTPSAATVCALAVSGDAVGLVNPLVIEQFRREDVVLRPFLPRVMFRAYLLFPPNAQKSRLALDFTAHLMALRNAGAHRPG